MSLLSVCLGVKERLPAGRGSYDWVVCTGLDCGGTRFAFSCLEYGLASILGKRQKEPRTSSRVSKCSQPDRNATMRLREMNRMYGLSNGKVQQQ